MESFTKIFKTAVVINESLANIDKFTYLHGFYERAALQGIEAFTLTKKNYDNPWTLCQTKDMPPLTL